MYTKEHWTNLSTVVQVEKEGLSCPCNFQADCGNKDHHWSVGTKRVSEVATLCFWCLPISGHWTGINRTCLSSHFPLRYILVFFDADETKQPIYTVFGEGESNLRTITWLNLCGCCIGLSCLPSLSSLPLLRVQSRWQRVDIIWLSHVRLPTSRRQSSTAVCIHRLCAVHRAWCTANRNSPVAIIGLASTIDYGVPITAFSLS